MKPLLPLLLAAGLLSACTDDPSTARTSASSDPVVSSSPSASDAPSPAETSPTTGTASASASPAAAAPVPFPADTQADTEQATGEPMSVVAVRASGQQGYDRVVFELRGKDGAPAGAPGWRVEYVDRAVQDGSGDEVEVAGDSLLSVFVEGVALPFETGQEEASQDLFPKDTDRVREVDLSGTFEGRFTAFVGLDQRVPFRVFRLADPARVVVDVRHS